MVSSQLKTNFIRMKTLEIAQDEVGFKIEPMWQNQKSLE